MLNGATCLKLFVSVYLMNLINVALGGITFFFRLHPSFYLPMCINFILDLYA